MCNISNSTKGGFRSFVLKKSVFFISILSCGFAQANIGIQDSFQNLLNPKNDTNYQNVTLSELAQHNYYNGRFDSSPELTGDMSVMDAVLIGLKFHPKITRSLADLSSENSYLTVAKASYYPQISSGFETGDFSSDNRGEQLLTISANQMLYDFGKTKTGVDGQKAKLLSSQATVLETLDSTAFDIVGAIINVIRYRELCDLAQQQLSGVGKIKEIAELRVKAGISSQADLMQAISRYQNANANLVVQQTQLEQWQEQLNSLLGADSKNVRFKVPEEIVQQSNLYTEQNYQLIPTVIQANARVLQISADKKGASLSLMPTFYIEGKVSQAINGVNPNNGKNNGADSSIMLRASSNLYQGGANTAKKNALASAELSAKEELNAVYLNINTQVKSIRNGINQAQVKMGILSESAKSSAITKALYREQYTLGKRSILDLLSSEQEMYSSIMERESTRFDVYSEIAKYIYITGQSRDVYRLNGKDIQGFKVEK